MGLVEGKLLSSKQQQQHNSCYRLVRETRLALYEETYAPPVQLVKDHAQC